MGERLHDGERGWFPSRVVEEIQSKELRTQNLREAFRIQQAQEGGGGLQTGARVGLRSGRRTPKVSSFSNSWTDQTGDSNEVKQWISNSDESHHLQPYALRKTDLETCDPITACHFDFHLAVAV